MAVAPAPRRCLGIFRGRLPLLAVVPMILYFSRCRRVATGCDGRELSQQKPSLRRFAWQKEPQRQFCWCDLCAGDGLLLCNKCEGRKYVNTEPGQAGVQFFGGTARCSICQGVATPTPHVGSRGPCHARFVLATRTARGGVS
eukprot:jgi/Tetstr1/433818/TSEL_023004.t1